MPPLLVLCICTAFVLYMLRLDRKQSPEVSFALWVPTIWILTIFSRPLSLWLQLGAETIEEGSPVERAFLISLLIVGLFILAKRKFNWLGAIRENVWVLLLLCYMLLSCLWSDIPFISFKRWSQQLIAVVMVFVVAGETNVKQALASIFRRIVYILIPFSYILIHYFPQYGRFYLHHEGILMWTGAAMHKNTLAQLCLFSALFMIWTLIRRRQGKDTPASPYQTVFDVLILMLSFWLWGGPQHTLTYSATATVAFVLGMSFFLFLFWAEKRGALPGKAVLIALTAFIIIYGTVTPMIGKLTILDPSSLLGREDTLTGRTAVWAKLIPSVMEKPILGYGFSSFWTTTARETFDIPDAHNGYLDMILSIGFAGLLLYAMFLLSSVRKAHGAMMGDFDWSILWICYLLMGTLINITESSFSSFSAKLVVVVLLFTFSLPKNTSANSVSQMQSDAHSEKACYDQLPDIAHSDIYQERQLIG